jgi:hypothetical protein
MAMASQSIWASVHGLTMLIVDEMTASELSVDTLVGRLIRRPLEGLEPRSREVGEASSKCRLRCRSRSAQPRHSEAQVHSFAPPSTWIVSPVIQRASSEARKAIAPVMSPGSAMRLSVWMPSA